MAKKRKRQKRRARSTASIINSRLQLMEGAAAGVALYGVEMLQRMPHGFDSLEAGLGKRVTSNKRIIILAAAIVFCITRKTLKWKLWSIPLTALLTLAVQQHKVTYLEEAGESDIAETY